MKKWIRINLIRRVLFGPSFNLRCFIAKARIAQRHPYLSVAQKERIMVLFKNYRRRVFWAIADNGLMPKGLLNESISALDGNSVLNEAVIMNLSIDLDAPMHRSVDKDEQSGASWIPRHT